MTAKRGQTGQSLVEFVLVIPLLLIFSLAIIDFGRGIFIYSVISNAAREGARYAIVHGSLAQAAGYANDPASGPGTSDPTGTIYVAPATKAVAYGLDANSLKVAVCWGFRCTVPADCTGAVTNTANGPGPGQDVTVRTCYNFQAITASFLRINAIPLSAQATLTITH